MSYKYRFLAFFSLILTSCAKESVVETIMEKSTPNILLIIADDMGKDALKGYTEGSIKANTPNIDALRTKGLLFNNFWSNPVCSPTRACILTGKYAYRTNVKGVSDVLSQTETSLQKYLNTNLNGKYATAVVGKWHLAGSNNIYNPESLGIDYFSGLIRGTATDFYSWTQSENGTSKINTTYATEAFTTLAIDWIKQQSKPWFMWLAYNAPHTPFHVPPASMHSQGALSAYVNGTNAMPYYMAAIEAMDFQIGRLLSNIPGDEKGNTIILFLGDNGPINQIAQSPYTSGKVKSSLYQGGINTPLIISGKGVSRTGAENGLVDATDLFSTIAELAGVKVSQINDSKSIKSLLSYNTTIRNFQYTELKDDNTDAWAISNGKYKLIINASGSKQMYALTTDPYETKNLISGSLNTEQSAALSSLESELINIRK